MGIKCSGGFSVFTNFKMVIWSRNATEVRLFSLLLFGNTKQTRGQVVMTNKNKVEPFTVPGGVDGTAKRHRMVECIHSTSVIANTDTETSRANKLWTERREHAQLAQTESNGT